jgi:hypothetical protein
MAMTVRDLEPTPPPDEERADPVMTASAAALLAAGVAVMGVGATGRFLPHDERFLGMSAADLCGRHGCRVVHFMAHDRVSFGGAAAACGLLYLWLVRSPLRRGEGWAWKAVLASAAVGFAGFPAFLAFGYLDTWHAAVTAGLLAAFAAGLARTRPSPDSVRPPGTEPGPPTGAAAAGRACLLAAAAGLIAGGAVIMGVGATCVFVPQDLGFLGVGVDDLHALNPRLVPLIAHDRAGFGGAVAAAGVAVLFVVGRGRPSPGRWAVLAAAGAVGFGPAIGVHPAVGYDDPVHLAPAVAGAALYAAGLVLTSHEFRRGGAHGDA